MLFTNYFRIKKFYSFLLPTKIYQRLEIIFKLIIMVLLFAFASILKFY